MKNKNIRKRLWCLLASCVSFVPSSRAMKTETSVDPSGYEASDEASDSDYNDFISKLNESKKKEKLRKKKAPIQTTEEEKVQKLTLLGVLSKIDKLDLKTFGIPTLWWLTGGRPVTTSWNKFMHNVDFFDSKYRKVMFRDVQSLNIPSRGHSISVGDTFRYTFNPAPILKEEEKKEEKKEEKSLKATIKSKIKGIKKSIKGGLSATKNFITRKTDRELQKEKEENEQLEEDSKNGTFFVSCKGNKQVVNFGDFEEAKDNKINKVIVYAQCDDVFLVGIPENIRYLTVVGTNNVSISSDLTKLKYFEVHCRNLYLCPPYKTLKNSVKEQKLGYESNLVEAVLDIRGLFGIKAKKFSALSEAKNRKNQKKGKKLELDYGFKELLRIDRNGNNNLPGFGELKNFKVTGSLGEGNWLKLQKKKNEATG